MKPIVLICAIIAFAFPAVGQKEYCPAGDCQCIRNKADKALAEGNFELAINKYQAWKTCNPKYGTIADSLIIQGFRAISALKTKAEQQTIAIYANNLAYNCLAAYKDGDITTAYWLAKLASFISSNNDETLQPLCASLIAPPENQPLAFTEKVFSMDKRVPCVAFSPNDSFLATGTSENKLIIWDLESQMPSMTFSGFNSPIWSVAFAPDGKFIATGSSDTTIQIWNVQTGALTGYLVGGLGATYDLAFSPDGKWLASGGTDNLVRIWNLQTLKCEKIFSGHTSWVSSIDWSPDGKRLASGAADNTIIIWDVVSGNKVKSLNEHTDFVQGVKFFPSGQKIASVSRDKTLKIWNLSNGSVEKNLVGHRAEIWALDISKDGKYIATAGKDQNAIVWNTSDWKQAFALNGHTKSIDGIAFSNDGKRVATASKDNSVRVWNLKKASDRITLREHNSYVSSVAFSADGAKLATGSHDHNAIIWDAVTGKRLLTIKAHKKQITALAFSPIKDLLAIASWDSTASLWDINLKKKIQTFAGHSAEIQGLAISPDGQRLATASYDKTVKVWNIQTGALLFTANGHKKSVECVAFSPDGSYLASGSKDESIIVWDANTGQLAKRLSGHTKWVSTIVFTPDSKRLISGSYDKTVKIWDLQSGIATQTLYGADSSVYSIAISPNGNLLACGSRDDNLKIWNLNTGNIAFTLTGHPQGVWDVAFSPDGKRLATASPDSTAKIWELTIDGWLAAMGKNQQIAPLDARQLKKFGLADVLDGVPDVESLLCENTPALQLHEFAKMLDLEAQNAIPVDKSFRAYAQAERFYRASIKGMKNPTAINNLAKLQAKHGIKLYEMAKTEEALPYLLDAYSLSPKDINVQSTIYPAINILPPTVQEALQQSPELLYKIALEQKEIGNWNQAKKWCEKSEALKHDPKNYLLLFSIGDTTGEDFIEKALASTANPQDLKIYLLYFSAKTFSRPYGKTNIPGLRACLNISEKILQHESNDANRNVTARYCNNLAWNLFFTNSGADEAEKMIRKGIELDPNDKYLPSNLPLALLLQGKTEEAKIEYLKWAPKVYDAQKGSTYSQVFLTDISTLEQAGITVTGAAEIRALLNPH